MLSLTGHVTAFDHFRQRLYLIENVFLVGRTTIPARRYDDAVARLDARVAELARPLPYVPSPPPVADDVVLPTVQLDDGRQPVPRRGRGRA